MSQAHLSGLNSIHITSKYLCPASIKQKAISHRAGFQTGFWLPQFALSILRNSPLACFHPPATISQLGSHMIYHISFPSTVTNCSSPVELLGQGLGSKTLKVWSKQMASILSAGIVPVLITSLPISLSEAPSQCAHLSSPLLCLQVPHLALLCCWNIWVAPSLLTVQFKEMTKALSNSISSH